MKRTIIIALTVGAVVSMAGISNAHPVARGAVVAFDRDDGCPNGWSEFASARSRVIVGATPIPFPDEIGADDRGEPLTPRQYRHDGGAEKHALSEGEGAKHHHLLYQYPFGWEQGRTGDHHGRFQINANYSLKNRERTVYTNSTEEAEPHNNMPPFIALYYCKKD